MAGAHSKKDEFANGQTVDVNIVSGGAGNGAILDGVDTNIKATVLDYTNSNPVAVRLTDTNGDYVAAGAGTQYTEDAAAAADPVGSMLMAVRRDTLSATEVSADGDNIALKATNKGQLHVKLADTVIVDGSGVTQPISAASLPLPSGAATSAKQDTIIGHVDGIEGLLTTIDTDTGDIVTSVQLIDDAIKTDDAAFTPATTKVMMAGFEYDDTTPDSVDEGDAGAARMSANRNVYTQIRDAAGNERGANVNASNQLSVSVDNTVTVASHAVTNAGTFAVQESGSALTALQLIDNIVHTEDEASADGHSGVPFLAVRKATPANTSGADGDYEFVQMSAGRLWVDASGVTLTVGSHNVTNAGTFAVQVDGSALTSLQLIDDVVFAEDAAHTTADKGVQVLTVRKDTAAATSGTDGDYQPPISNARGATWVAIEDGAGGQITSFGGGTEYTEDAAAAADPVGKALILVRKDTPATIASADGDNVAARGSNYGALYTTLVDNAGNFVSVGGGTQYDEDAASAGAEKLTLAGAVRQDTLASNTSADGDYTYLKTTSAGRLYTTAAIDTALPAGTNAIGKLAANDGVDIGDVTINNASLAVTNSGTFAVQESGSALTALQLIDDTVFTDDAAFTVASSKVNAVGYMLDDTSPDTVNEGDIGIARMSSNRNQYVQIRDNAGNERGLNIDANGALAATVTNATAANLKAEVVGPAAHDAAASGNPILMGIKAETSLEGITTVADGDVTHAYGDADGVQMMKLFTPFGDIITERVSNTDGNSTAFSNFNAGGAGVRNYVTTIAVFNSSATNGYVDIRDGTAGSIIFTVPAPATGGSVITFPVPLRQTTANTALAYDVSGALSTVYISAVGFQSKL